MFEKILKTPLEDEFFSGPMGSLRQLDQINFISGCQKWKL